MNYDDIPGGDQEIAQESARCQVCCRQIRGDDGEGEVQSLCQRCGVRFMEFLKNLGRNAAFRSIDEKNR